jgi:hypothetical protein
MRKLHIAIALTLLLFSSACEVKSGQSTERKQQNTMNMQEAADRADVLLDATVTAIRPPVQWIYGQQINTSCADLKNESTGAGRVARYRRVMTIISSERRGNFLGIVERYWKASGYEITGIDGNVEMPAIFATSPEGFKVSLEFGEQGRARFLAQSACVAESEVSMPMPDSSGSSDSADKENLIPNVRSDFWSAATPVPTASPSSE